MSARSLLYPYRPTIIKLALAVALVFSCRAVGVELSEKQTLQAKATRADEIYQVRVASIQVQLFADGAESKRCGTNYRVEVIERFKGRVQNELTFAVYSNPLHAAYRDVNVGDELLVLISALPDESDPYGRVVPDVLLDAPSVAQHSCIRQLSTTRLIVDPEAAYYLDRQPSLDGQQFQIWLEFAKAATAVPDDPTLRPEAIEEYCNSDDRSRCAFWRVPWESVAERLREWSQDSTKSLTVNPNALNCHVPQVYRSVEGSNSTIWPQ